MSVDRSSDIGKNIYLSKDDFLVFYKMVFAFQELVLSMVRNAAFVLPNAKNSALPSSKMHEIVNKKNFSYNKPIATRDVFLYCLPCKSRKFYGQLIQDVVVKNDKIAILVNHDEVDKLNEKMQLQILKNLLLCANIINITNRDFQRKLPEAKQQGRALIRSIKPRRQIPEKARCTQRKIDK
ncbi:MAG: hypothetical protein IJ590_01430 [Rickettsiales bacterium]|nr:hypothetical protein [Rickettsiales bacterium]